MPARRYDLTFSDVELGHPELGFIPRVRNADGDDEDRAYERHLARRGLAARVRDGVATVQTKIRLGVDERFSAGEYSAEFHDAVGVSECRFLVASVSKGPQILDTFESDAFEAGTLNLEPRTREQCERSAREWCATKLAAYAGQRVRT